METPKTIFLVEDEVISAITLAAQLRKMGFTVPKAASTGEEAIAGAEREKPDLILMDINLLGNMDGITAAVKIKMTREVPIIFITGYSDGEIMARAYKTKPAGILTKPLDLHTLQREILKVLDKSI